MVIGTVIGCVAGIKGVNGFAREYGFVFGSDERQL